MKSAENGYGAVAKAIHRVSAGLILVLIGSGGGFQREAQRFKQT